MISQKLNIFKPPNTKTNNAQNQIVEVEMITNFFRFVYFAHILVICVRNSEMDIFKIQQDSRSWTEQKVFLKDAREKATTFKHDDKI